MVMGLLGFCGMGGKLMLPVRGKLMGKVTASDCLGSLNNDC